MESAVSDYIGVKYAVGLSSGTSALHLAMIDAGVKAGDKVFSTDMTFAATCNPIMYQGAEPIFIDVRLSAWMTVCLVAVLVVRYSRGVCACRVT